METWRLGEGERRGTLRKEINKGGKVKKKKGERRERK